MTSFTRRALLKGAAAAAAAGTLPTLLRGDARADGTVGPERNLVIVFASGGWDTTYVLDPKPGAALVDTPEGTDALLGDLRHWSNPARPAVDRFFARWADRSCIVNGVQVRSFIHTDCVKRILTGGPSETAPDLGAIAANELGASMPVPYLALGAFARSGQFGALAGRTGTTNQIAALLNPDAAYADAGGRLQERGLILSGAEEQAIDRFLQGNAERLRAARGGLGYNGRRVDDFVSSIDRARRFREFSETSSVGEREFTQSLEVQVPLTVRALAEGLSQVAFLQAGDWDTHVDNGRQNGINETFYTGLDQLATQLDDADLLDRTTVVVMSEMGRTPRLNSRDGKDHWPVTSAIVLGAGVRGSSVVGATDDQLDALSIDLETGVADPDGSQLQTPNLVAGLLENVGVDPAPYFPGSEPFRAFRA